MTVYVTKVMCINLSEFLSKLDFKEINCQILTVSIVIYEIYIYLRGCSQLSTFSQVNKRNDFPDPKCTTKNVDLKNQKALFSENIHESFLSCNL